MVTGHYYVYIWVRQIYFFDVNFLMTMYCKQILFQIQVYTDVVFHFERQ